MWMAMRDHAGRTALAYDDNDCKFGGLLNAAVDNGSVLTWDNDNEYGGNHDGSLVKFGLEMELKDELQDSRLFNKEDGGAGAKREAEGFFGG